MRRQVIRNRAKAAANTMNLFDSTFPSPEENLACDEALLDFYEEHGTGGALRFWEPQNHFVVVGYGNHVASEVYIAACEADRIPILRRCSGGGTVLQGPGCLNYSLILKIEERRPLATIGSANRFIMERNRAALESKFKIQNSKIQTAGHTDLVVESASGKSLKFSGNSQRRKKHFLLFHGTFLLNFNIALVEKYLRTPSKEPAYRTGRSHANFLTNLNLPADTVRQALRSVWKAADSLEKLPCDALALLVRDKYVTKEWNFKF
jgi:lipoate-protein ligase A